MRRERDFSRPGSDAPSSGTEKAPLVYRGELVNGASARFIKPAPHAKEPLIYRPRAPAAISRLKFIICAPEPRLVYQKARADKNLMDN